MKKISFTFFVLISATLVSAQSMKMVVDSNNHIIGRWVSTNPQTFTVLVQDDFEVPKEGNRVVMFRAEKGHGILFRNPIRTGKINVRNTPSTSGTIVTQIPEDEGIPTTYKCLGKEADWYKVNVNGKVGYVRDDMMEWDGMDTF